MTQPITAKTPTEIVEEIQNKMFVKTKKGGFEYQSGDREPDMEVLLPWLASSMRSLLEHVVEMLPKERHEVHKHYMCSDSTISCDDARGEDSYNMALDDCISTIRKIQESIK